ncbi:MAG: FAD-binding oxidoreductase [Pseudaminobacter sp.]|nr:FAD-binding oxidoreductase [Pseudaminobacter sp.]
MSQEINQDIVVIGAGIVGICAATLLAEAGRKVTVLDRTGICEGTSSGNAGGLAFSEVLPMAHKNMLAHVPKWLMDPLGPLSIPPARFATLLPWLYRFWRAGAAQKYEGGLAAQAAIMKLAEAEWTGLMARSGTQGMLRDKGALELYESDGEFKASLPGWAARDRFGIPFRHLERRELQDYQPGLASGFTRGTFLPGWKTVSDPKNLGKAVWRYAEQQGAQFIRGDVESASPSDGAIAIRLRHGRTIRAQKIVIAAGAWSHLLARQFGEKIPLETERGYNTTLPAGAFDVKLQLSFPGHGFVIAPLDSGLRVGGAVEFGGLSRQPNYARSKAMLEKAKRFLPGLDASGGREWMGFRPSLPDSLPVIGRAKNHPDVIYAFGHGHLGLTQAAATASLIRGLVMGQSAGIDLSPFSAQRF